MKAELRLEGEGVRGRNKQYLNADRSMFSLFEPLVLLFSILRVDDRPIIYLLGSVKGSEIMAGDGVTYLIFFNVDLHMHIMLLSDCYTYY